MEVFCSKFKSYGNVTFTTQTLKILLLPMELGGQHLRSVMKDIFEALQSTPVPNILVISGILFLFLAFVGKIGAFIEIPEERQKWSAIVGLFLLIFGTSIFIFEKKQGDTTEKEVISSKKNNNKNLSSEDLTVIRNGTDAKELSKSFFNKTVELKGSVYGSYSDRDYMVLWVLVDNNLRIGCLSAPSNSALENLRSKDLVKISGAIHHIEPHGSFGNQLILARGCTVKKENFQKNSTSNFSASTLSAWRKAVSIEQGFTDANDKIKFYEISKDTKESLSIKKTHNLDEDFYLYNKVGIEDEIKNKYVKFSASMKGLNSSSGIYFQVSKDNRVIR